MIKCESCGEVINYIPAKMQREDKVLFTCRRCAKLLEFSGWVKMRNAKVL